MIWHCHMYFGGDDSMMTLNELVMPSELNENLNYKAAVNNGVKPSTLMPFWRSIFRILLLLNFGRHTYVK